METLARILNSYAPVGLAATELVFNNGTIEQFRKNEVVFAEKRFNAFEYFQYAGISHRFNTNSEQQQVSTGIFQNETVITPHFARTANGQSIFSVQALTDCTFLKVPARIFREIMDTNSEVKIFGRSVVERELKQALHFEVLHRSHTAKDLLLYVRELYPGLENMIPHTIIASFLGITPVSLSRLRADMAKGQR